MSAIETGFSTEGKKAALGNLDTIGSRDAGGEDLTLFSRGGRQAPVEEKGGSGKFRGGTRGRGMRCGRAGA